MADVSSSLLGKIAVAAGYLTDQQLDECLREQHEMEQGGARTRLGEILKHKGFINDEILEYLLNTQKSLSNGLFGEIAVRFKFATADQVEKALRVQDKTREMGYSPGLIGEIMVEQGFLDGGDVLQILEAQEQYTVKCGECGMKYNAWKWHPGQRINCAMCGSLVEFAGTSLQAREDSQKVQAATPVSGEEELEPEEESLFPEIPGYTISAELGHSEDSTVFDALQDQKDRRVTIELMTGISSEDTEFMGRLQQEAKQAISLHHPAIKNIYAIGKYKGHPYIVTEYVDSESLYNVISREKTLPLLGATQILIHTVGAMKAAHDKGLVHGDIKPSMILFMDDGGVKISKMGIAKKFRKDMLNVSERSRFISAYMAPELIIGKSDADMLSDIYSLGAVYFHLLTGNPPYEGDSPKEIIISISAGLQGHLRNNPQVPASVSELVEKMLATNPEARPQNYDILLMRLKNVAGEITGVPRMMHSAKAGDNRKTTRVGTELRDIRRRSTAGLQDRGKTTPAGGTIKNIEKKEKTPRAAIAIRLIALVVLVIGGLFSYKVFFRDATNAFTPSTSGSKETPDPQPDPAPPVPDPGETGETGEPDPAPPALDPKVLAALLADLDTDVSLYADVKQRLEELKVKHGQLESIDRALERADNKYRGAARDSVARVKGDIEHALEKGAYREALAHAQTFVDTFYGLDEAKEIDKLRMEIPARMAEVFLELQRQIDAHVKGERFDEALKLTDMILRDFEGEKYLNLARDRKAEIEKRRTVTRVEKDFTAGVGRMKMFLDTHADILKDLRVLDAEKAAGTLKAFRGKPEGRQLARLADAMAEEIRLVADLRERLIARLNRGMITKSVKAPGGMGELTIKSADIKGVTAPPVTLLWKDLDPADLNDLVSKTCNLKNGAHLAELAVYSMAAGDKNVGVTWLQRSSGRDYDTSLLKPVFPTKGDMEAEEKYKRAMQAYKAGKWEIAADGFAELKEDYPETAIVLRTGYDRLEELIQSCRDEIDKADTEAAEAAEREKEAAVTAAKESVINLNFHKFSDMKAITPVSGKWKIVDEKLSGQNEFGKTTSCRARIAAIKPFLFKGRIKFEKMNEVAISVTMGENEIKMNIAENLVFFTDADKSRRQNPVIFNINQWYDIEIRIDWDKKKVKFRLGNATSLGDCDVLSDDVVFFVDQPNTIFLDDIHIEQYAPPAAPDTGAPQP